VIEIDGSNHYYGLTKKEIGKNMLKYRTMEKCGLNVDRIEYFDFLDKERGPKVKHQLDTEKIHERLDTLIKKEKIEPKNIENIYWNLLLK
jgi:hypothetical protein